MPKIFLLVTNLSCMQHRRDARQSARPTYVWNQIYVHHHAGAKKQKPPPDARVRVRRRRKALM